MPFPIRCFTCGKVIGNKWDDYVERSHEEAVLRRDDSDLSDEKLLELCGNYALDQMKIRRMCCRRMFISHPIELDDLLSRYNK